MVFNFFLFASATWTDQTCLVFYSEVRIEGLETLDYLDNLFERKRFTEQGDAVTFESEVHLFMHQCDLTPYNYVGFVSSDFSMQSKFKTIISWRYKSIVSESSKCCNIFVA